MLSTSIATQPTEQATIKRPPCDDCPGRTHPMCCTNTLNCPTKPVSRLLALYGQPPIIHTQYATRQNPDRQTPARQVQCPHCHAWQPLTHTSHCTSCCIDLAKVEVA